MFVCLISGMSHPFFENFENTSSEDNECDDQSLSFVLLPETTNESIEGEIEKSISEHETVVCLQDSFNNNGSKISTESLKKTDSLLNGQPSQKNLKRNIVQFKSLKGSPCFKESQDESREIDHSSYQPAVAISPARTSEKRDLVQSLNNKNKRRKLVKSKWLDSVIPQDQEQFYNTIFSKPEVLWEKLSPTSKESFIEQITETMHTQKPAPIQNNCLPEAPSHTVEKKSKKLPTLVDKATQATAMDVEDASEYSDMHVDTTLPKKLAESDDDDTYGCNDIDWKNYICPNGHDDISKKNDVKMSAIDNSSNTELVSETSRSTSYSMSFSPGSNVTKISKSHEIVVRNKSDSKYKKSNNYNFSSNPKDTTIHETVTTLQNTISPSKNTTTILAVPSNKNSMFHHYGEKTTEGNELRVRLAESSILMELVDATYHSKQFLDKTSYAPDSAIEDLKKMYQSNGIDISDAADDLNTFISSTVAESLIEPMKEIGVHQFSTADDFAPRTDSDTPSERTVNTSHIGSIFFTPQMMRNGELSFFNPKNQSEMTKDSFGRLKYTKGFWNHSTNFKSTKMGKGFRILDIGAFVPEFTIPEPKVTDHTQAMQWMASHGPVFNSGKVFYLSLKQEYATIFVRWMDTEVVASARVAGFHPLFLFKNAKIHNSPFGLNKHQLTSIDTPTKSYLVLAGFYKLRDGKPEIITLTNKQHKFLALRDRHI